MRQHDAGAGTANALDLSLSRSIYRINPKHETRNPKQIQMIKIKMTKTKTIPHASNCFCFEF